MAFHHWGEGPGGAREGQPDRAGGSWGAKLPLSAKPDGSHRTDCFLPGGDEINTRGTMM